MTNPQNLSEAEADRCAIKKQGTYWLIINGDTLTPSRCGIYSATEAPLTRSELLVDHLCERVNRMRDSLAAANAEAQSQTDKANICLDMFHEMATAHQAANAKSEELRGLLADGLSIVRLDVRYTSSPSWEHVRKFIADADAALSGKVTP